MSTLFVDQFKRQATPISAVRANVADTITSITDDLYVTVPAFDGGQARWGPCQRSPKNALPQAGEDCLLILTQEDQTPWVILGSLVYPDPAGESPKVLTADTDGLPKWEPAPS